MPKTSAVQRELDKLDAEIDILTQVRERLAATLQEKPVRTRTKKKIEPKHDEPTR